MSSFLSNVLRLPAGHFRPLIRFLVLPEEFIYIYIYLYYVISRHSALSISIENTSTTSIIFYLKTSLDIIITKIIILVLYVANEATKILLSSIIFNFLV